MVVGDQESLPCLQQLLFQMVYYVCCDHTGGLGFLNVGLLHLLLMLVSVAGGNLLIRRRGVRMVGFRSEIGGGLCRWLVTRR